MNAMRFAEAKIVFRRTAFLLVNFVPTVIL